MDYSDLVRAAFAARENAYAPYSDFLVGAALLAQNGKVYRGCNVENAAYGPSNCAERTALFAAVCDGARQFSALAIVGGARGCAAFSECFPCGVCRQVLVEFCPPDFPVIVARAPNDFMVHPLCELLPHAFGGEIGAANE